MSEKVVQSIRQALGQMILEMKVHSPQRIYVDVAPENLVEAARRVFRGLDARYAIATALQVPDGFEVIHHFGMDAQHVVLSLRVRTGSENPEVPSITSVVPAAEFIEREMYDLVGIRFPGHPNPKRLLLAEDWPDGVYPLRRGKPWEGKVRKEV